MSEQSPEQNVDNLNQTPASVDGAATDKAFLNTLRQSIDAVDCEIQTLINNRAKLAQQVATVKKDHAASRPYAEKTTPFFNRLEREAQGIKAVMERHPGPLADEKMARWSRGIMSVCLDLEAPQ